MNEAETRAEHIDPALKAAGWGVVEGSRVLREHGITLAIFGKSRRPWWMRLSRRPGPLEAFSRVGNGIDVYEIETEGRGA